jgi:hypothetical protein
MARIYVSSTYRDLKDYREVVYRTLGQLRHDVSAMEDYVAAEERPLEKCLHDVASCDLYVGIFAFAYGYVPDQGNPERKSITELEYRKAGELGIPRLVFLVQEGAAWPTTLLDALGGEDGGRRIAALREDLKKEHTDSFFQSAEELARKVSIAVQQALGRMPAEAMQIDWEEPRRRFVDHMRLFAGARSGENAFRRYVSLPLQATRLEQGDQLPVGVWEDLVTYPGRVLLNGEAGSGKTTLLLREAERLARIAREVHGTPLPISLSLRTFAGGDADTLLETAAEVNRMDYRVLRTLWFQPRRPICLLIDGVDETAYREQIIEAIAELARVFVPAPHTSTGTAPPEERSLVVACRPGPLRERIAALPVPWLEFLLMPLRNADLGAMLTHFDAASLLPFLDERLREIVRRPDLLSALAQSARDRPIELLPRNAAEVLDIYFRYIFTKVGGKYDYDRIKRPILARLAYTMARTGQAEVACDDTLYEWTASALEEPYSRYHRQRRIMPYDWTSQELYDELLRSPVVETTAAHGTVLTFTKAVYRDYFTAVHLATVGAASQDARDLISQLGGRGEQLQPLGFLLAMAPDAATLFDDLPASAVSEAAQVWLEDGPGDVPAPQSIRNAYRKRCDTVRTELFDASEPAADEERWSRSRDLDPRARFGVVSAMASEGPLPALALLEAADDDHPLVRAIAEYALVHAGDPCSSLSIAFEKKKHFRWHSYGGGTARIGPMRLLRVPVPMAVD